MKHSKAIYDGQQVILLEPVDLPPDTPLDVVVLDELDVLEALKARGLILQIVSPVNSLVLTTPLHVDGPPVSQTLLDDRE